MDPTPGRRAEMLAAGLCPAWVEEASPSAIWSAWKAYKAPPPEPEVYIVSDVTGWVTQVPLSEAVRRGLDFADTPQGLGLVEAVKRGPKRFDPRQWEGEWGAWRDLPPQERIRPNEKAPGWYPAR